MFEQLNNGRKQRLGEEMEVLRALPERRFDIAKRVRVRVSSGSLIHVERNSYSVNSWLIGEIVEARIFANHVEVWYGGQKLEELPRLRGEVEPSGAEFSQTRGGSPRCLRSGPGRR